MTLSLGGIYKGITKHSINTHIKELSRSCKFIHPEKPSIAEHALGNPDGKVLFDDIELLSTVTSYYPRPFHEAIVIAKHNNNFNRQENSTCLYGIWLTAISNRIKPLRSTSHTQEGPV